MAKNYKIRKHQAIKDFLKGGDYLISGTEAWDSANIDLGQTCIHAVTTVYNDYIEGKYKLKDIPGRFEFIKKEYPKPTTKEYWLIDMLNNIYSLDIGTREAIIHIARYLRRKYFDIDELNNLCKKYAKENTINIIKKSETIDITYFLENENSKVINLTCEDIYIYNNDGTKVIKTFPKNGIVILTEDYDYEYYLDDFIPIVVKNYKQPEELPMGYDIYIVYITVAEALRDTKGIVFADISPASIIHNENFLAIRNFCSFYKE